MRSGYQKRQEPIVLNYPPIVDKAVSNVIGTVELRLRISTTPHQVIVLILHKVGYFTFIMTLNDVIHFTFNKEFQYLFYVK